MRLQANAHPLKPAIQNALHRFDAEHVSKQKVLLSTHTLFRRVAHLAHAKRVFFLPGSEVCMALFVKPDAHLVDIRNVEATHADVDVDSVVNAVKQGVERSRSRRR